MRTGWQDGAALWSRMAAAMAILLLAGCVAQRVRPDASLLAAQERRESALATRADWTLAGRLAVSGPADGGSGALEWSQHGHAFRFSVQAPVTGKTWILSGDSEHARIEGLSAEVLHGSDATTLVERELGWKLPVEQFAAWVRGARAPGSAELEFRPDGLPSLLVQDGWRVEYLDYMSDVEPALPKRIFASQGDYKVRLVVQRWQMP
jgi:outer membrane lipoprotein LolB